MILKFIQRSILNDIVILDSRLGKYIRIPFTSLTSSKYSSKTFMCKTIFNNLDNEVKDHLINPCKIYSSNANDIIIKKYLHIRVYVYNNIK